ncbi:UNVERIFIED_CONTAM: hypothetical protein K2H54_033924, partial [Gekko kuhli]
LLFRSQFTNKFICRSPKMPFYLRKLPLEIPPPTEKEWIKKDEEEAFFLKDPDQIIDYLPQPFQVVNKLVTVLFERAWEIIEGREQCHVMKKQHPPPTRHWPSAEFQVVTVLTDE